MDSENRKYLSRRDFVKVAGLGLGATAMLAGLNPASVMARVPKKWDQEFDIIAVGAGGAGLAAAVDASAAGRSFLVLEKMPVIGGSSLICGGALAFAGTDMQKEQNIKDSNELLYKDIMKVGDNVNVPSLVKAYVDNQLDTYYWLKKMGIKFIKIGIASGMSVPRAHYVSPPQVIKTLSDKAKSMGTRIMVDSPVTRLIADDNGDIRGVIVERKGKKMNYGARRGVILTSGGFSLNKKLLAKFVPPMAFAQALVGPGSNGDGLKMAWAYGSDIEDMPYIKATFGFAPNPKSISTDFALVFYAGAIIVNKEGKRFVNESKSYKLVGDAALVQPDAIGFQIYDSAIREAALKDPLNRIIDLEKQNRIYSAPTLGELARKLNIPAQNLEETVRDYNANVEKGIDPQFGRTTLVASFGKPVKIYKPPFYGFPSTAVILGTYGGILIDDKTRVVDIFGNAIPRLYAAGEVIGGFHGAAYMTGTAFGKALVFGRIAARSLTGK
ncbi:MAG: flavocytochrome c [Syntrophales bacterium]